MDDDFEIFNPEMFRGIESEMLHNTKGQILLLIRPKDCMVSLVICHKALIFA